MKKLLLLGSTGSIGTQTLEYISHYPDEYVVVGLICGSNIDLLRSQIEKFNPKVVAVFNGEKAKELKESLPGVDILSGREGVLEAIGCDYDLLINATVGISGLEPTYETIKRGKDVALANKESLVTGGSILMNLAREKNVKILPIDSEHSAIFQCLQAGKKEDVSKLYLTASGGPFRNYTLDELKSVSLTDALKHPNWEMGKKITIDSATMMNKGFELIEARWLFDINEDDIEIVVHRESIIHSMVEFNDNSVIAQLGTSNMITPISYCLTYPDRLDTFQKPLNIFELKELHFEEPRVDVFKNLKFARDVLKADNSYSVALNGANEVLVNSFIEEKIKFLDIQDTIEKVLQKHSPRKLKSIEEIVLQDLQTREITKKMIGEI